jgi:hypothetical protein
MRTIVSVVAWVFMTLVQCAIIALPLWVGWRVLNAVFG